MKWRLCWGPIAALGLAVGCAPSPEAVAGHYYAKRLGGGDSLWLRSDGVYVQHAVLRGQAAQQTGRWSMIDGDVVLESPLYVDEGTAAGDQLLTPSKGVTALILDQFWLDRSLGAGEDRPRYRRVGGP